MEHILHDPGQIRAQRAAAELTEPVRVLLCATVVLGAVLLYLESVYCSKAT